MRLLALDLSLRYTGWATNAELRRTGQSGVFGAGDETGLTRIASLRDDCLALARQASADLIVLEGISYGSVGAMHAEICGLAYVVRLALHEAGYPLALIPPTTLKKFATGTGAAKKVDVLLAAARRFGYEGNDDNEADALWLLKAGLHHYGLERLDLPKAQLEALAKVDWPIVEARV